MTTATQAHKAAAQKGLQQAAQLVTLEDLSACSTAELVGKVAGDALQPRSPGPGATGQAAAAVQQLLQRFERCGCFCGCTRLGGRSMCRRTFCRSGSGSPRFP